MTTALSDRIWLVWFLSWVGFFSGYEGWGLISGHPEFTLSAAIWRLEKYTPNQSVLGWSWFHFMFIATLLLLDLWLIGHFGWHLWAS